MKHNAHPFKQLLVLIGSQLGMLVPLVFLIIIITVVINKGDVNPVQSTLLGDNPRLLMIVTVLQSVLLFLVPVLIVANVFYRDSKREFYCFDLSSRKWLLALLLPRRFAATAWQVVQERSYSCGDYRYHFQLYAFRNERFPRPLRDGSCVGLCFLVFALIGAQRDASFHEHIIHHVAKFHFSSEFNNASMGTVLFIKPILVSDS